MSNQTYRPDCACQARELTQDDLTQMYEKGKYSEINDAFNAGRFNFDDNDK